MTDETTPEQDQPVTPGTMPSDFHIHMDADASNPKPDTAQGVAELLSAAREHVEEHAFGRVGIIASPSGVEAPVLLTPHGSYEAIPLSLFDDYSASPTFRRGKATMTSLDSFIAHVNRFGDEDSAVFANDSQQSPSLLAVLDYHRKDTLAAKVEGEDAPASSTRQQGEYRSGRHRTQFSFPVSDQWKAWHDKNGETMRMAEFSVFLEDNVLDVAEVTAPPASADRFVKANGGAKNIGDWASLIKLAKSLAIFENGVVTEAVNLANGAGQLTIKADLETEVEGIKTDVPTMFFIDIPIFREGAIYRLPVRLRYRKSGTGVLFWYELWRSDRAFTDAFHEAIARIDDETEAQVFYGSPE